MFKPDCSSLDLPKISVVTPSYNQGKYIRETIDSVLSQSYPNLEYIVIDGGSTDETLSVINDYEDRIDYFVSEPDEGQSHAINKGFEQATGDILCWLNSDDQFAPDALWSVALAFIQSSADLVAGICEIYEDSQLVHRHLTSCANGPLPLQGYARSRQWLERRAVLLSAGESFFQGIVVSGRWLCTPRLLLQYGLRVVVSICSS